MAGMKFGSLFDDFFDQFKRGWGGKTGGGAGGGAPDDADIEAIVQLAEAFKALTDEATKVAKEISDLEREFALAKVSGAGMAELQRIQGELNQKYIDAKDIERDLIIKTKELEKLEEKHIKNQTKWVKLLKYDTKSLDDVQADYESGLKKLIGEYKTGAIQTDEFEKALAKLELEKIGGQIAATFNKSGGDMMKDMGGLMTNGIGSVLRSGIGKLPVQIGAKLMPIVAVIQAVVMAAFNQILELNEALIGLSRSTGGVITAAKLGYDIYGNSVSGLKSFKTAAIEANLSVKELSAGLEGLIDEKFTGQVIGLKDDLSNSQESLMKFATTAGIFKKKFDSDITPAVQNLMLYFNKSMDDSTDLIESGASAVSGMGLSVKEYTKNLEIATELMGKFYLKNAEEAVKLSVLATRLGTSVEGLARGVVEMEGITDLFEEQQKTASLGMTTLANQLSKIYALRKTGEAEKASTLELKAIIKDLGPIGGGMINKAGVISGQGQTTLKAVGATDETILALQKMAQQSIKTGIALETIADPTKQTEAQKAILTEWTETNMTIQERLTKIWESLKQSIIDPLAEALGPIISAIEDLFEAIGKIIGVIVKVLAPIFAWVVGVIKGVAYAFSSVFGLISDAFDWLYTTLEPVFTYIKKIFTEFGTFFGYILGAVLVPLFIQWAAAMIRQVWTATLAWIVSLWELVVQTWKTASAMKKASLIGMAIGAIVAMLLSSSGKNKEGMKKIWKDVKEGIGGLIDVIGNLLRKLMIVLGLVEDDSKVIESTAVLKEIVAPTTTTTTASSIPTISTTAANATLGTSVSGASELAKEQTLMNKAITNPITLINNVEGMFSDKQIVKVK